MEEKISFTRGTMLWVFLFQVVLGGILLFTIEYNHRQADIDHNNLVLINKQIVEEIAHNHATGLENQKLLIQIQTYLEGKHENRKTEANQNCEKSSHENLRSCY
jgi:hypothetical protein